MEIDEAEPSIDTAAHQATKFRELVDNREIAFTRIREVAEYFRRNEPQSPVPYILDRAVHWGNLPLPDLISEITPDEGTRKHIYELTGIEKLH